MWQTSVIIWLTLLAKKIYAVISTPLHLDEYRSVQRRRPAIFCGSHVVRDYLVAFLKTAVVVGSTDLGRPPPIISKDGGALVEVLVALSSDQLGLAAQVTSLPSLVTTTLNDAVLSVDRGTMVVGISQEGVADLEVESPEEAVRKLLAMASQEEIADFFRDTKHVHKQGVVLMIRRVDNSLKACIGIDLSHQGTTAELFGQTVQTWVDDVERSCLFCLENALECQYAEDKACTRCCKEKQQCVRAIVATMSSDCEAGEVAQRIFSTGLFQVLFPQDNMAG